MFGVRVAKAMLQPIFSYICVHLYICVFVYVYLYVCVVVYLHVYMFVYLYVWGQGGQGHVAAHLFLYLCTFVYLCVCVCLFVRLCSCIFACLHVCIFVCLGSGWPRPCCSPSLGRIRFPLFANTPTKHHQHLRGYDLMIRQKSSNLKTKYVLAGSDSLIPQAATLT